MNALVVDDSAVMRKVLTGALARANNYIIKPCEPATIVANIQEVLGQTQESG